MHLSAFMTLRYHRPWHNHTLNKFHWNAFTQGKGGAYFVCCYATAAPYQLVNPADVSRHYCSVRTITLPFVVKFCSSCFSSFNLSCPFLSTTHIYYRFTIQPEQISVNTSWYLTFGRQDSFTVRYFKCTVISAILESTVVLPSIEWNNCNS